jgi:HAD superfamily hydrolase (TIGR01459 family)
MMKRIAGLRDIADQFDLYFVDQYGVLHDGVAAYPGAVDGLARLASGGRKVIVLTNSGKGAPENLARLGALGFANSHLHAVVSSGGVALQLVSSGVLGPSFARGADVCVIGRRGDTYAFSSADFRLVARPQDAAFLVFAGSDAPRTSLDTYRSMLTPAAQVRVPAICINPDITMIRDGELVPAPGAIAKVYQNLGGSVEYVGKPHSAFFHHALTVAATSAITRAVMIGDSPEHDICGAKAMGLSTLLVRTGIHQSLAEPQLVNFCTACGGTPDFLAAAFKW